MIAPKTSIKESYHDQNELALAKFLENCISRIDLIDLPDEDATRNYVNNINVSEKAMLVRQTEEFLKAAEDNLAEFNRLSRSTISAEQARNYMGRS